jgi:hypothetical protein
MTTIPITHELRLDTEEVRPIQGVELSKDARDSLDALGQAAEAVRSVTGVPDIDALLSSSPVQGEDG